MTPRYSDVVVSPLKTLTYVSTPARPFAGAELDRLIDRARRNNALDGITGLLVFNGARFSQTIEGAQDAIDDLWRRLEQDPRHTDLTIRSHEPLKERVFAGWDMRLLEAPADRERALGEAEQRLLIDVDLARRAAVRATVDNCFV